MAADIVGEGITSVTSVVVERMFDLQRSPLQIIKRPMDLRTIMNKLKQQLYDTPQQVVSDTRLIFDNCRIYNENGSEICDVCLALNDF